MKQNFAYYIPGLMLITIGLLIAAVPEILVVLLVSMISMTGIFALYAGHLLRKQRTLTGNFKDWDVDIGDFNLRVERIPVYHYHRWQEKYPRMKFYRN